MRGRTLPAAVICVVLAGCAASDLGAAAPTPSTTASTCAAFAGYARMPSTTVTFLVGCQMQTDPPLDSVWADFTRCTGIRIVNEVDQGTLKDFYTRLNSGFAPDLTVVAQPGSIVDLVHRENRPGGHPVVPLPPRVASRVDRYWNAAWRAYGTVDGTLYAAPWDANVKSVVWYSPKVFAAAGYRVPTTWRELMAFSDRVAANGKVKPWCGGIESGRRPDGQRRTGSRTSSWQSRRRGVRPVGRRRPAFDSPEIRSAMAILADGCATRRTSTAVTVTWRRSHGRRSRTAVAPSSRLVPKCSRSRPSTGLNGTSSGPESPSARPATSTPSRFPPSIRACRLP